MRRLRIAAWAWSLAILVLLLAQDVSAGGVLVSDPHGFVNVDLLCVVSNVGKKQITGRVEIVGTAAEVLTSMPFSVAPSLTANVAAALTSPAGNPSFCRLTLDKGPKKDVRATAQLREQIQNRYYFFPLH